MIVIFFSCIFNVMFPCYISLPHTLTLIFLIYYYFKFLHFTSIFVIHILLVHTILFTSYTISTSYTNIHYTVFDVYVAHKKSSFLVIGVLFGLHNVLAAFVCILSAFPLINSILVSSVEVADGPSYHFKLIGGFWLVKRFVILCPVSLAIFSLPEEFICSLCRVN